MKAALTLLTLLLSLSAIPPSAGADTRANLDNHVKKFTARCELAGGRHIGRACRCGDGYIDPFVELCQKDTPSPDNACAPEEIEFSQKQADLIRAFDDYGTFECTLTTAFFYSQPVQVSVGYDFERPLCGNHRLAIHKGPNALQGGAFRITGISRTWLGIGSSVKIHIATGEGTLPATVACPNQR
jgi:hypothetical protein